MTILLGATLTAQPGPLRVGEPIRITLTITNTTSTQVTIINPDVGTPPTESGWQFSSETYQIAVLISFQIIEMALTRAGVALPLRLPNPWVTPILMPPLNLAPGASFALHMYLNDFFDLDQPDRYQLSVRYGDAMVAARAEMALTIEG